VTAEAGARACAACGERGSAVRLQTVKALLTALALRHVQLTHYRFCANPACETVYFGDAGDRFAVGDIRVPVWQKEPGGARLLCYCFGETESAIRSELLERGRTDVLDRIREHIAAERCACDIRNPRGACCLGEVSAAVTRIDAELATRRRTNHGVLTNLPDR
jgi:CopZ-like zinc binding protein